MEYEAAVRELEKLASNNWRIGEIADSVEPRYGERTLQQLAEDTGIGYKTLLDCKRVYVVYERGISERSENPWVVFRVFANQKDREELVRKPWTVADARAEVAKRKKSVAAEGEQEAPHDWAVKAEAAVRRALESAEKPNHEDIRLFADIYEMVLEILDPDIYKFSDEDSPASPDEDSPASSLSPSRLPSVLLRVLLSACSSRTRRFRSE